jgi:hypothetical protein
MSVRIGIDDIIELETGEDFYLRFKITEYSWRDNHCVIQGVLVSIATKDGERNGN